MATSLTEDDLLAVVDRVIPESYLQPIKDVGPGYELYQGGAAMMARCSRAAARFEDDVYISTSQGGGLATVPVTFFRATAGAGAVTMLAGTIVSASSGGQTFRTTADVAFGATDLDTVPVTAIATGYGYEWNVAGPFVAARRPNPTYLSTTDLVLSIPVSADHITFATPSGLVAGDLLLLVAGSQVDGTTTVTTPGWSTLHSFNGDDADNVVIAGYYVTGQEGATLTVNFSQDMDRNELIASVIAYRNAPSVSAVIASPTSGPSLAFSVPSQAGASPGDLYIGIGHDIDNEDAFTTVPGNSRYNATANDGGLCVFDIAAIGPVSPQTLTVGTGSGLVSTFSLLLRRLGGPVDFVPGEIDTIVLPLQSPVFADPLVQVRNDAPADGLGRPRTLDVLGGERNIRRHPSEGDVNYRGRIRTLPDTVSPAAIKRQLANYFRAIPGLYWRVVETWQHEYQECFDAPATTSPFEPFSPNLFCFDDPRPPSPIANRLLGMNDYLGAFIVEVAMPPPFTEYSFAFDDGAIDEADLQSVVGIRAFSAFDVPPSIASPSLPPALDGRDLNLEIYLSQLFDLLTLIKAGGIFVVIHLQET